MAEFDSSAAIFKAGAEQLSKMVSLDMPHERWGEEDLPAMLDHQLSAKLDFDLRNLALRGAAASERDQALSEATAAGTITFRDLLLHPPPPLVLLRLAKDFFKRQAGASDKRRPEEQVAYLMYLLLIVVAKIRLREPITRLTHAELLRCIEWGVDQEWVTDDIRALLRQGAESFSPKSPPAE